MPPSQGESKRIFEHSKQISTVFTKNGAIIHILDAKTYPFSRKTSSGRDRGNRTGTVSTASRPQPECGCEHAESSLERCRVPLRQGAQQTKGKLPKVLRAKRPKRLPSVLCQDEVQRLSGAMKGTYSLMARQNRCNGNMCFLRARWFGTRSQNRGDVIIFSMTRFSGR
jgi:hypothetical protein